MATTGLHRPTTKEGVLLVILERVLIFKVLDALVAGQLFAFVNAVENEACRGNRGEGVAGVAWMARIVCIKGQMIRLGINSSEAGYTAA